MFGVRRRRRRLARALRAVGFRLVRLVRVISHLTKNVRRKMDLIGDRAVMSV